MLIRAATKNPDKDILIVLSTKIHLHTENYNICSKAIVPIPKFH